MTAFDRLEQQLRWAVREREVDVVLPAAAVPTTRRRWWWRHPRAAAISAAALVIAAPALAATRPWEPLLGRPSLHDVPNGTSRSEVPPSQTAVLSVLRRPQDAADRGPVAEKLLRHLGIEESGVRIASIRLLDGSPGREAVLVSVQSLNDLTPGVPARTDTICVLYGQGGTCGGLPDLLAGHFLVTAGSRQLGLVPDGVARVLLRYPDGETLTAPVRDNFFEVTNAPVVPAGRPTPGRPSPPPVGLSPSVRWLDAHRAVVGPPARK